MAATTNDTARTTKATAAERGIALAEAAGVGVVVASVVVAALMGTWNAATRSVRDDFHNYLITLAQVAAHSVDAELHESIRTRAQTDSPQYKDAVAPLRRLSAAVQSVHYLYTVRRDGSTLRFVLDAAEPGDHDGDGIEDRSIVGDVDDALPEQLAAFGVDAHEARPTATSEPFTDQWGTFMSGFAPIRAVDGRVVAVAGVDVDATVYVGRLAEAHRQLLLGMARASLLIVLLALGTYWIRLRARIDSRQLRLATQLAEEAARRDRLTGLSNRAALLEQLAAAVQRVRDGTQRTLAVLFLDFDHFKHVNDSLGHEAGDELLRQIAVRLRRAVGSVPPNVIARFGGDEFVVLLNDLGPNEDACDRAAGLLRELAAMYVLKGTKVNSSASIGVYVSSPGESLDPESAVLNADVAMYAAKRSGRACYVPFDDAMRVQVGRRIAVEKGLLRAIGTPELQVLYQPIIELATGHQVAAEAVVRWHHPDLGEVSPSEFMPIAEQSGLIVPLGEWLLHEVCTTAAAWQRCAPDRAPQWIAMSLTRLELALGDRLLERIRAEQASTGIDPHALQFQIPERIAADTRGETSRMIEQVRALGVRLSMNGFPSGTAALACLGGLAFGSVKISQDSLHSLASNRDAMAVVHATMTLLENLGLLSIADGVEDPAQLAILQSLGCSYAQGPFFSEPVHGEQLLEAWPKPRSGAPRAA